MSEVISFRLDKANSRESQAIEILNAWLKRGFSTRFVLTKALLELDHHGSDLERSQDDRSLDLILEQLGELIEIVKAMPTDSITVKQLNGERPNLNENLLSSIKLGIKPGIRL